MTDVGRHGRNISWLLLADVSNKVLSVFYFAYLSRRITVEENGWYGTFISFSFILLTLNTLGFPDVLIREGARDRGRIGGLLPASMVLGTGLFLMGAPGVWVVTGWLDYPPVLRYVALLAALSAFLAMLSTLQAGVVAAHERFRHSSLVDISVRAAQVATAVALLYAGYGVIAVLVCYVAFQCVHFALLSAVARRLSRGLRFTPRRSDFVCLLREGATLAGGRIAGSGAVNLDVPLLNALAPGAAGYYSMGTRFYHLLATFGYAVESVFYPVLSRRATEDAASQRFAFERLVRVTAWMVFPMAAGMTVLAEPLIELLAGAKFLPGATATVVLTWALALAMLERTGALYLRARSLQTWSMYVNLCVVAVKLGLSLAALPRFGVPGLLAVNAAVGCAWTAATLVAVRAALPELRLWALVRDSLARPALAAAIMAGVLVALGDGPLILWVVLGACVYGAALYLLGGFDRFDRQVLRETLPVRRRAG